jgi:hypothetical protein
MACARQTRRGGLMVDMPGRMMDPSLESFDAPHNLRFIGCLTQKKPGPKKSRAQESPA